MRYTPSGQAVCNISVATNRKWTGGEGQSHEETVWFRVACWGRLAEVVNEYLTKGRQVMVEGRLSPDPQTGGPRVWQDANGNARASYELTALEVKFLGGRDGNYGSEDTSPAGPPVGVQEDEIPF